MEIKDFSFSLDENKVGDFSSRAKELRAMNNSAEEMINKLAKEFRMSTSAVENRLLPRKLKDIRTMNKGDLAKLKKNYPDMKNLSDGVFRSKIRIRSIEGK